MFKRKVESFLINWKNDPYKKPLIIKGPRQCGKTYSALDFARKNYKSVVYLNFFERPELIPIFSKSLNIDYLTMRITGMLGREANFMPGDTIIIFDEIQDCPEARTSLKFFSLDGRYDIIATGSLLGLNGYGKTPRSIPVGYESFFKMTPLDFEEFLWANGIEENDVNYLKNCLDTVSPVDDAYNYQMRELLLQYAVVGGMPEAVQIFLDTKDMNKVRDKQIQILSSYEDDMVKYANEKDKGYIRECFESIPSQLSRENKKFVYNNISANGKKKDYYGSLKWMEDADIISRCFNLYLPQLPLDGNSKRDTFKVYMKDCGLLTAMCDEGTQGSILLDNLYIYKGAIFENLVADIFSKMGRKLYYFRNDSGLEIDFVIRYKGEATLIEVKAKDGNAKSVKTILNNEEKYHCKRAIKLCDKNIGEKDGVLTLPLYLAFLLKEY